MCAKPFRNGRSPALDPWFAEERCSVSALVIDLLIATHALALDRTLVLADPAFLGLPELKLFSPLA